MKPSERITEISKQLKTTMFRGEGLDNTLVTCGVMIQGIIDYLDEEYEANRPCFVCKKLGCKEIHP